MNNELIKKVLNFQIGNRVSVTKLARSNEWRKELEKRKVMEVLERTETIAVLLNTDVYENICEYIRELESQIENLKRKVEGDS